MNEALKINNIKKYFDKIEKSVATNFIYAYEDASNSSFLLLGGLSFVNQKYYIVAFFPEEIILVPLTVTGKFRGEYVTISRKQIHSMRAKNGLMQYKLTIKIDNQKFVLKCNKFILNTPWQKENIQYLENNYW